MSEELSKPLILFLISIVLSLAGIHVFYFILGIDFYVFVTTLLIEALCVEQIAHGTCAGRIIVGVQTQVSLACSMESKAILTCL